MSDVEVERQPVRFEHIPELAQVMFEAVTGRYPTISAIERGVWIKGMERVMFALRDAGQIELI